MHNKRTGGDDFYITPKIPKQQIIIISVRKICSIPKDGEILALSDLTKLKSVTHYFVFTQTKLYYNHVTDHFSLTYARFPKAEIIKFFNIWHNKHVTNDDDKLEYSSSDAADKLAEMLNEIKSIVDLEKEKNQYLIKSAMQNWVI